MGTTGLSQEQTAQAFSGTTAIEGFAGGGGSSDEIDIEQLHFGGGHNAVSWTQGAGQGTLAITGGDGKTTLDITLIGTYTSSADFQIAKDGLAGTVVTTTNSNNAENFAL